MPLRTAIQVGSYNLAAVVDPLSKGTKGTRDIESADYPLVIKKTMYRHKIVVAAYDLTLIVDPGDTDIRGIGKGKIDRSIRCTRRHRLLRERQAGKSASRAQIDLNVA